MLYIIWYVIQQYLCVDFRPVPLQAPVLKAHPQAGNFRLWSRPLHKILQNLERLFYGGKGQGKYGEKQNQTDHLRLRMCALLG